MLRLIETNYFGENDFRVANKPVCDDHYMEKRLARYLRPHRLRSRLTQEEIARLLGYADGSLVSRIENGIRSSKLLDAFALQVIFDVAPTDLFPSLYNEAEAAVMRRANALFEDLQGAKSKAAIAKIEFLNKMQARAIARRRKPKI